MNPFTSNKCGTQTKTYLNYCNNNCYITPYSNVVINKASARPGGGLKSITNGRCLTGAGWCPCSKAQTHSKGKCGKVDGSVYECKSGQCCFQHGYCGKKQDYCGYKCQSSFGTCWAN